MGNRRLTDQQRRRIEENAVKRRENASAGFSDDKEGMIVARYSKTAVVRANDGEMHTCHLRPNLSHLVAGDHVLWSDEETGAYVTSQLERRSELKRPDARGQLKAVAANVDLIAIVVAPEPEPYANLIDRYLVAAHMASIDALIILNKSDLLDKHPDCAALLENYRSIGYEVMTTGPTPSETQALSDLLGSRTSVFVGQSGVGKSSMINRLLPDEELRVGALSEGVLKGRHTTTTAEVFERPSGGFIIDSPGIREFGLQHIDPALVAPGFIEFRPFLDRCRFRDCSHLVEKDCGVLAALENNDIRTERYESFVNIVRDIDSHSY
ncbi:MAG: ribosome small subunit-dependent GTPase A [Pseudomonadota bacterium]|nr:ribosome small subunit-dependent GTPase A [Pseudomonadota bacterium]